MADLDPSTPPDDLYGSSQQLSAGYDDDGMDINALHAELDDEPLYDDDGGFESHYVDHEAGAAGLHEDIDGAGGWTGDEVLGVEAGEGEEEEGGMLDINQEALLMDEDMDLEMHSELDSRPVSRLDSYRADSPRSEQKAEVVEALVQQEVPADEEEGGMFMTTQEQAASEEKDRREGERREEGVDGEEGGGTREQDGEVEGGYSGDEFEGDELEEERGTVGGRGEEAHVHQPWEAEQEVIPSLPDLSPTQPPLEPQQLGEVFTLDRLTSHKPSAKPVAAEEPHLPAALDEKPSKLRKPSVTPPATDIDSLLARLEHSQAAPPQRSTKAKEGKGGERKESRVADQIKGTVDEMEREVEAQRQHAGAVRARRRGGADDPQRRSKSALRERPGSNSGSGDSPSRRRARSSDPPAAKEKAREKGWTFKSSLPVKKVPASKIEVSKPSEEEIKKRKKWAAEKVRVQKEQEAKEAARAKRAEEKRRAEKEARELEIKERLQARAQARAAQREQHQQASQTAKSPGAQRSGKTKPLYQRLEEQAARKAAREEAEKVEKYHRELGAARRRKTTAIIKEAQAESMGETTRRGGDETALVLPELGHSPSHKPSSQKYFSSHNTPATASSPKSQTVSKSRTRFPKVKSAEPSPPPPLPPLHPDSDMYAMMGELPVDQGGMMPAPEEVYFPGGEGAMEGYGIPPGPVMLMGPNGEHQDDEELPFHIVPYGAPEPLPMIEESPSASSSKYRPGMFGASGNGTAALKDAATSVSASFSGADGVKRGGGVDFRPQLTDVLAFNIMISAPQRVKPVRLLDETLTLEELAALMPPDETLNAPLLSGRSSTSFATRLSQAERQRVFVGDTRTPAEVFTDASTKLNTPLPPKSAEKDAVPPQLQGCNKRLSGLATVDLEVGSFTRGRGMELVGEAVDDGLWGSPAPMGRHPRRSTNDSDRLSVQQPSTGKAALWVEDDLAVDESSLVYRLSKTVTPDESTCRDAAELGAADSTTTLPASEYVGEVGSVAPHDEGESITGDNEVSGAVNAANEEELRVGDIDDKVASVAGDSTKPDSKPTSRESSRSRLKRLKQRRDSQGARNNSNSRRGSASGEPSSTTAVDEVVVPPNDVGDSPGPSSPGSVVNGKAEEGSNGTGVETAPVPSSPAGGVASSRASSSRGAHGDGGKASSSKNEVEVSRSEASSSEPKRGLERLRSQKEQRRCSSTAGAADEGGGGAKAVTGLAALRRLSSSRRNSMASQREAASDTGIEGKVSGVEGSASSSSSSAAAKAKATQLQSRRLSGAGSRQTSLNRRASDSSRQPPQRQASDKAQQQRDTSDSGRVASFRQQQPPVGTLARKISRIASQRRNSTAGTAPPSAGNTTAAPSERKVPTTGGLSRTSSRVPSRQYSKGSDGSKQQRQASSLGDSKRRDVDSDSDVASVKAGAGSTTAEGGAHGSGFVALPEADDVFQNGGEGDASYYDDAAVVRPVKSEMESAVPGMEAIDEELPRLEEEASVLLEEGDGLRSSARAAQEVRMSKALSSAEFPVMPRDEGREGDSGAAGDEGLQALDMPLERRVSPRGTGPLGEDGDGVLMASPMDGTLSPAEPHADHPQRRVSSLQPRADSDTLDGGYEEESFDDASLSAAGTQEVASLGKGHKDDIDDVFGGPGGSAGGGVTTPQDHYPGSSALASSDIGFGSTAGAGNSAGRGNAVVGDEEAAAGASSVADEDIVEGGDEEVGYSAEFDNYEDDFEDA